MSGKIDLAGSITLNTARDISVICKPLLDCFNIHYFRYMKMFCDGSRIILTNQADIMKFFYEEAYYPLAWHDQAKLPSFHSPGYINWAIKRLSDAEEQKKLAKEIDCLFNLKHGLAYVENHGKYVEIYDFGASNLHIYDINNSIFRRFIYYFKDQTREIVKRGQFEKIIVPPNVGADICPDNHNEQKFIEATRAKRYYLNDGNENVYLTDREVECLNWCIKGKTAAEISMLLQISQKTVERHLENVKIKLNSNKQTYLAYKAIKLGLINFEY